MKCMHGLNQLKAIQDDHNQSSLSYCWGVTFLGPWYSCQWRDGEEKKPDWAGWMRMERNFFQSDRAQEAWTTVYIKCYIHEWGLNCDKVSGLGTLGSKINLILVRSWGMRVVRKIGCMKWTISLFKILHILWEKWACKPSGPGDF